jgi:hypothetical protein
MRTALRAIIWCVPVIAYIAILILANVEQDATFWVSLCFLTFSYLMLGISAVAVPRSRVAAILSIPLVLLASIYFGLEFIAATVFIYGPSFSFPAVVAVQIILAALFLVVFATTMLSNETIAAQIEEQHADVQIIKNAVARLSALRRNTQNPQIVKSLEGLEEEFRYSPTARSRAVYPIDERISAQLGQLESLVARKAATETILGQISAISAALATRNSDIKLRQ